MSFFKKMGHIALTGTIIQFFCAAEAPPLGAFSPPTLPSAAMKMDRLGGRYMPGIKPSWSFP